MRIQNILLKIGFIILISIGITAPVTFAMSSTADLSGEFSSEIGALETSPDYDETPTDALTCTAEEHTHTYILESINTSTRTYMTGIHAFAIVLDTDSSLSPTPGNPGENDFLSNVDTENLMCTLRDDIWHSCGFDPKDDLGEIVASGTYVDDDGDESLTTITYQTLDFLPGNPRGLVWRYSADDFGNRNRIPYLKGRESSSDAAHYFNEMIAFGLNAYTDQFTATTTSYTLVEHQYADPDDDTSKWANWDLTYTIDEDADQDGNTSDETVNVDPDSDHIYWYGMNGTVRSIFDDCENACTSLQIDPSIEITPDNVDEITTFTITSQDQNSDAWDGTYEYAGYESNGTTISSCIFANSYVAADNELGSNPLTTDLETVYVYNCEIGDTITVHEIDSPEGVCIANLSIEDACSTLEINTPATLTYEDMEGGDIEITISATGASGDPWIGEYTYTATKADGTAANGTFATTTWFAGTHPGWPFSELASNPFTTTDTTIYYGGGEAGDIISIHETNSPADVCLASIASTVSSCGDGTLDTNGLDNTTGTEDDEECDDGGNVDGDGCSATCKVEEACATLEITDPTVITYEDMTSGEDILITIETTATPTGDPWIGEYTYTATQTDGTPGHGTFSTKELYAGRHFTWPFSSLSSNPYTTDATSVYYGGGDPGDIITVTETAYPDVCFDSIASAETQELYCENLSTEPTSITIDQLDDVTPITLTDTDQNGDDWAGTYTVTSTNASGAGTCKFTETADGTGTNPLTTTASTVYVYGCTAEDTISIQENTYPNTCSATMTTGTTEAPYCASLTTSPASLTMDQYSMIVAITLTDTDQNGGDWTGTYTVTSTNADATATGSCKFSETQDNAVAGTGSASLTTTESPIFVYGCATGDTITIQETAYPATCSATLATGTPSACLSVSLSPTTVTVDTTQIAFTLTPNPSTWPGPWTWTATNSTGGTATGTFTADNGTTTGNSISTADLSVEYSEAVVNDVITVVEATSYGSVCHASATIVEGGVSGGGGGGGGGTTSGGSGTTSGGGTGTALYCGDGKLNDPSNPSSDHNDYGTYEECDDGNSINNDGCSNVCQIEDVCGAMTVEADGNTIANGDTLEKDDSDTITFETSAFYDNGTTPWTEDPFTWKTSDLSGKFTVLDGTGETSDEDGILTTSYAKVSYTVGTDEDATISVNVDAYSACSYSFFVQNPKITTEEKLEKFVYTYNFGFYKVDNTTISGNKFDDDIDGSDDDVYAHDYDYTFYTIAYTPDTTNVNEVTIIDSIANGIKGLYNDFLDDSSGSSINFYTANGSEPNAVRCWVDGDTATGEDCGNPIGTYRDFSVRYEIDNTEIEACTTPATDGSVDTDGNPLTIEDQGTTCWSGSINNPADKGLTLTNLNNAKTTTIDPLTGETISQRIAIRYLGQVDNGTFNCSTTTEACPVVGLTNTAETNTGKEANTTITIICPYLLTRNAGDVYFEENPDNATDPFPTYDLSCYYPEEHNSDGLVFISDLFSRVTSCGTEENDSIVGRFSSYICEMMTDVKTVTTWSKETIEEIQNANITAITRYNENLSSNTTKNPITGENYFTIEDFADLNTMGIAQSNEKQNVYKITNGNLIFNLGSNKVPSGAYTFIVEGGDLYVNSNIEYAGEGPEDNSFDMSTVTDLSDIPSIAFIVIGGNVHVDNDVTEMVGVYYIEARDIDGNGVLEGGKLTGEWTNPFTKLVIRGSVYGSIESLLENRTYAGPANYDQGNVVLRYDERVLLNTPPGLEKFVDVQSEEVAR